MNTSLIAAISGLILPLLLAYLLMFVRLFERRRAAEVQGRYLLTVINIRDAAIATLALDLAELTRVGGQFQHGGSALLLVLTLFVLHSVFFVFIGIRNPDPDAPISGVLWPRLITIYIALILLMTNAVTILRVINLVGTAR